MTITAPRDFRLMDFPVGIEEYNHHLAFVIDDVVQVIVNTTEDSSDNIKNADLVIQVESISNNGPDSGWVYNSATGEFSTPSPIDRDALDYLPYRIAYINSGVVQEVLNVDERTASVMLSNPEIVNVDIDVKLQYVYNADRTGFIQP
jgi:hypothetical protein